MVLLKILNSDLLKQQYWLNSKLPMQRKQEENFPPSYFYFAVPCVICSIVFIGIYSYFSIG